METRQRKRNASGNPVSQPNIKKAPKKAPKKATRGKKASDGETSAETNEPIEFTGFDEADKDLAESMSQFPEYYERVVQKGMVTLSEPPPATIDAEQPSTSNISPSKSVTASEDATIASDKNPPGALKTSDIGEIPPVIRETPPVSRETHPVTVTPGTTNIINIMEMAGVSSGDSGPPSPILKAPKSRGRIGEKSPSQRTEAEKSPVPNLAPVVFGHRQLLMEETNQGMETSMIMETDSSEGPVATTTTTTTADTSGSSTEPLQNTENASRDGDFDNEGSLEEHAKDVDEARNAGGDKLTIKPIIQQKDNETSAGPSTKRLRSPVASPQQSRKFKRIVSAPSDDSSDDESNAAPFLEVYSERVEVPEEEEEEEEKEEGSDEESDGSDIIEVKKRDWRSINERLKKTEDDIAKMKEKLEELNSTEQEGDGDDEIDLPNLPINDWDEFEEVEENIRNNKHFKKAFIQEISEIGSNKPIKGVFTQILGKAVIVKFTLCGVKDTKDGTGMGGLPFNKSPVYSCLIDGLKMRYKSKKKLFDKTKVNSALSDVFRYTRSNWKTKTD